MDMHADNFRYYSGFGKKWITDSHLNSSVNMSDSLICFYFPGYCALHGSEFFYPAEQELLYKYDYNNCM